MITEAITASALDNLFQSLSQTSFEVVYWNGQRRIYGDEQPLFRLILKDEKLLYSLFREDPSLVFGEAYLDGRIDVEGDLIDVIRIAHRNEGNLGGNPSVKIVNPIARRTLWRRRDHYRQKQDIATHYDLGNEFFHLWLDNSMTYSCAYFKSIADSLEDAQVNKIDYSLRKLRIENGQSLLDIGCGWGALMIRAAEYFGACSTGITLSENQATFADFMIKSKNLTDQAVVQLKHYNDLGNKRYDRIISIGMIEHVGKPHLDEFFQSVANALNPGGLALLHMITSPKEGPVDPWIDKYVFPGGYIPAVAEIASYIYKYGFRLHDVENLCPHYLLTLEHWSERFERSVPIIRDMYDERFVRMWRLYLRGATAAFAESTLEVHQFLVSNGLSDALPMTRSDLYR